ncbi:MAG: hypothetical protein PHY14_03015 [Candidatus Gracilibacteria bacterium]|nr:hypothetical protein [Candidatus Gracilibacteria bacterium]
MNLILLGIYLVVLVILFAFVGIVIMHIGNFRQYSRFLTPVIRIYLVIVILIALFGAYKIYNDYTPSKINRNTNLNQMDF